MIGKKKMRRIVSELKEIKRVATMKTASFSSIASIGDFPSKEKDVDSFIKERTRLWRRSWLVDPLQKIIEDLSKGL